MDLRSLKYFSVLAEELHFGKAANKLFIAQPPLSRQIKLLEEELGVQLFKRNSKKVELTLYGKYLKGECDKLFTDVAQIKKNIDLMKNGKVDRIIIGYVGGAMHSVLPMILKNLKQTFGDINFILKEFDNSSQIESLNNNTIDIGFVRTPMVEKDLEIVKLYESTFSIIIPKTHHLSKRKKIALEDLKDEPFIRFSKTCAPSMHKSIMDIFIKHKIEPNTVHETSQMNALVRLVESGFGYAIVPSDIKNGYNLDINYYELIDHDERTEISLIFNKKNLTDSLQNIIDIVINMFAKK